jgi:hypothetical protein
MTMCLKILIYKTQNNMKQEGLAKMKRRNLEVASLLMQKIKLIFIMI